LFVVFEMRKKRSEGEKRREQKRRRRGRRGNAVSKFDVEIDGGETVGDQGV
jgi:hypothetical protein